MEGKAQLRLRILTPKGSVGGAYCDSVHLSVPDDENGAGGGSMGVRRGHMPAFVALNDDKVTAFSGGIPVFTAMVHGGVAEISDDVVTILTDAAEICSQTQQNIE